MSARLAERGVAPRRGRSRSSSSSASPTALSRRSRRDIQLGPWIAHVSGATPLDALDPHVATLRTAPAAVVLQGPRPEQLDGVWGAVTAETDEARAVGFWLAETLGLRPFELDDANRAAYHAGAAFASNYLVTLRAAAGSLLEAAGAPPEALDPLIRGVMDSGFELTGPIARGDWETVERHLAVIRAERPELEELYLALAEATARFAVADCQVQSVPAGSALNRAHDRGDPRRARSAREPGRSGSCRRWARCTTGHLSLLRAARAENETVVMSLFVNPAQFGDAATSRAIRATRSAISSSRASAGVDLVFAPSRDEMYPPGFQTWVDVTELGSILEGRFRPGPLPRRGDGRPQALHDRPSRLAPTSGRRTRSRPR